MMTEPENYRQALTARPLSSQGRASISPLIRESRKSEVKRIACSSSFKGISGGPQI